FAVNGALGGFAFVFIPALEIIAGDSPVVAGSALVPVTVVTLLLSGASGRLAQRIGPRPQLVAGCALCAVASVLAVRVGSHAGYWAAVLPVAVLFGLGLASLLPPLTATAATFITGPRRPTPARGKALIQTPVPHLTCPVAFPSAPEQTRPDSSQASGRSFAADAPSPSRLG
ncbi:MAG TPA: hypothetical protein VH307_22610, partial [Streptosporangiaceae bacterium]|nr:hypothetical protein [Streptosporangiaceae bacterium]